MDDIGSMFSKFKESKYAIPVGMVLTFAICYLTLRYVMILCIGPLIVAAIAYVVPKYFGLKDIKKHLAFGLVLFIGLGLVIGFQNGTTILEYSPEEVTSENGELLNGTLSDYRGDLNTQFGFTVVLAEGVNASEVLLELTDVWATDDPVNYTMSESGTVEGGTLYVYNTTVDDGLYQFRFLATVDGEEIETDAELGPLTAGDTDVRETYITGGVLGTFLGSGVIFILIATMTFWMRRNMEKAMERSKRDESMPPAEGEVEKFICSECGAEVPADAKECPQCGERFEVEGVPDIKPPEEPAKKGSFICSECGAEVSEDDDVCPKCGERFED